MINLIRAGAIFRVSYLCVSTVLDPDLVEDNKKKIVYLIFGCIICESIVLIRNILVYGFYM